MGDKMEDRKMTDSELTAELRKLKTISLIATVFVYLLGALMIVMFITGNTAPAFVLLVLAFAAGWFKISSDKKIKKLTGDNLMSSILTETFGEHKYLPHGHLSVDAVKSAGLDLPEFNEASGSDYLKAAWKGLPIELSNIQLDLADSIIDAAGNNQERRQTIFTGVWMICDTGKKSEANVRVTERSKQGKGGIRTEIEEFNARFNVASESELEAFRVLTPHMMERIMKVSGGADKLHISFLADGKVHIALEGKQFFGLGNGTPDASKLREKFTSELSELTNIIEELGLRERKDS